MLLTPNILPQKAGQQHSCFQGIQNLEKAGRGGSHQ